ncbi:hypothetical protein ACHAXT_001599 [Thalassiosira profunda]
MNITQRRPPRSIGEDVEGGAPTTTSRGASIDREAPLASPSKRKRPPPRSSAGNSGIDCAVHTLRKFATAIFRDNMDDDALKREDVTRIDVLATLLKEVAISCLIAFSILTALLFVGRYLHIHIPIAHKYERALVNLLYDESVMQRSFDEDGLKLMPVEEYTNFIQEINNSAGKIKMEEEVLEARTRALEEARKERAQIELEYPKLFGALNLDHFCADCKWSGGQTCLVRAAYLEEKYPRPRNSEQ